MRNWKSAGIEPSIDELLDDDVMVPVMRSAGVCAGDLRALVTETAERWHQDDPDHAAERLIDGIPRS